MILLMKNITLILSLFLVSACLGAPEPEPVSEQSSELGFSVLAVTNLRPTTTDLYVVKTPGAVALYPSKTTSYLSRLPSVIELELVGTYSFMYIDRSMPHVMYPARPGVEFSAVVTRVN